MAGVAFFDRVCTTAAGSSGRGVLIANASCFCSCLRSLRDGVGVLVIEALITMSIASAERRELVRRVFLLDTIFEYNRLILGIVLGG